MQWAEICIHTTHEAVEIVSNILHEAGSGGVVIEDPKDLVNLWNTPYGEIYDLNPDDYPETGVDVKGYFPAGEELDKTIESIKRMLGQLSDRDIDFGSKTIEVRNVDEEDWATSWKQYYKPISVTDNITITPIWENYEHKHKDEIVIKLDPGMAFGTGTHQTTTLCIKALEKFIKPGDHVIDVGTGSGILSIAAAKLGAGRVSAYDVDPVAVSSAKENIKLNHVQSNITVENNNLLDHIDETAHLIIGNLLAPIVIQLAKDVPRVLKKNGLFISSGIIKSQQKLVEEALLKSGLAVEEVMQQDDWIAVIARNVVE